MERNYKIYDFFEDISHIIYVNGEYRGESDSGKLMHDFSCTTADDMYYNELADRVRYFKEDEKGVEYMCKILEDMVNEEKEEIAVRMLEDGLSEEKVAEYCKLELEAVKELNKNKVSR